MAPLKWNKSFQLQGSAPDHAEVAYTVLPIRSPNWLREQSAPFSRTPSRSRPFRPQDGPSSLAVDPAPVHF